MPTPEQILLERAVQAADASTAAVEKLTAEVHSLKTEVAVLATRVATLEGAVKQAGERGWQVVLAAIPGLAGLAWMAIAAGKG